MIEVTRLDGSVLVVNSDLLETVERTPDSVITLVNGHKLIVSNTVDEIVERVIEYRRKVQMCPLLREQSSAETVQRLAELAKQSEVSK